MMSQGSIELSWGRCLLYIDPNTVIINRELCSSFAKVQV